MNNINRLKTPFEEFTDFFSNGSTLLIISTLIAVVWANLNYHNYEHFWHSEIEINNALFNIKMGLLHWINDGLMAIFFFVVGLEIKRELLAGELSTFKQASLPIFAAIGGIIVPIIIYMSFGLEGNAKGGWGIPMATDIAFSLGILSLLGKRVPLSLKVFLTALAIVDDLGAVIVIAIFYSGALNWTYIFIAAILLSILVVANLKNIQNLKIYTFLGFIIWYLFLQSGLEGPGTGLHATIAGVLIALTIPARPKVAVKSFLEHIKSSLNKFQSTPSGDNEIVLTDAQLHVINDIEYGVKKVQSPLQSIEHQFHGFIGLIVIPVFALANAGVALTSTTDDGSVFTFLSLAIAVSLVFGKVIGITLFSWIAVKSGIAVKPKYTSWLTFMGLGLLGGIGFTMSIFIASLGFKAFPELLNTAKIGVFIGSIAAGLAGFYLLKYSLNKDSLKRNSHKTLV